MIGTSSLHGGSATLLAQAGGNDFIEGLIQLAFVALFFGVPILRGILGERSKRAGGRTSQRTAPAPKPTRVPEGGGEGRDLWKQLLEGIEQTAERPGTPKPQDPMGDEVLRPESSVRRAQPKPRPAPLRTTAQPAAAKRLATGGRQSALGELGEGLPSTDGDQLRRDLPSASRPIPSESELEVSGGDERIARRALSDFEGMKARSSMAAGSGSQELRDWGPAAIVEPTREVSHLADAPADWSRAVVLAEILGPPIALRDADGNGLGPAAFR